MSGGDLIGTPFTDLLGIEQIERAAGTATLTMEVKRDLHNRRGVVHGGALATMLDTAMARAARNIEEGVDLAGTIDLNVKFLSPGEGRLTATGTVMHMTGTLAFCQGEVRNEQNELVALASATLKLRRKNKLA
jgi:uncharacterized protein (TIGR00369 family)